MKRQKYMLREKRRSDVGVTSPPLKETQGGTVSRWSPLSLSRSTVALIATLACLSLRPLPLAAGRAEDTGRQPASLDADSAGTITSDTLFTELLDRNHWRDSQLQRYSVRRIYRVTNSKGALKAEEQVSLQFEAPGTKTYSVVLEKGSATVRRLVFKPLLESEVETAGGRSRHDSSITPSNYSLEVVGQEEIDGRPCYVVIATPLRKTKYLFKGKVWIDSADFAVVKIDGEPAKNPSWWTKKIHFVRQCEKIGDFWLPRTDESVTTVRVFGTHILTIEHQDYQVGSTQ